MEIYRCIRCDASPPGPGSGVVFIRDTLGRRWICQPDRESTGSWEGWLGHASFANSFAQLLGEQISTDNPFEDVDKLMKRTVVVSGALADLPTLLGGR